MPELEEKTPVYDVVVWLHEDKSSPITVAYKKVRKEANEICGNLQPQPPRTLTNTYFYPPKEGGGHEAWLNKAYIVRCEVKPVTRETYLRPNGYISSGFIHYEPVYLEDLESEND